MKVQQETNLFLAKIKIFDQKNFFSKNVKKNKIKKKFFHQKNVFNQKISDYFFNEKSKKFD